MFYLTAVVLQSAQIVTHFTEDFDPMISDVSNEYMSPGCHHSAAWQFPVSRHAHGVASSVGEVYFLVRNVTDHITCFGLNDGL